MTAAPEDLDRTALAVGAEAAGIWGDETEIASAAVTLAARRISKHSDPKTTARPASELAAAAGETITRQGLGGTEVLRIFEDIIAPATRAQDDPMNLAYIPAAPTRAALAFDAVVSTFNIYGGAWEAGAGAIFAENQALAWLGGTARLAGDGRRMLRLRWHHRKSVRPGRRPADPAPAPRPASGRAVAAGLHRSGPLLGAGGRLGAGRRSGLGAGGR